MGADRAYLRRFFANADMAAVGALPDHIPVLGKYQFLFNVFKELAVSFLMLLFNGGHALKQFCDLFKALFPGFLCKIVIHICPLVVLAACCFLQVFHR